MRPPHAPEGRARRGYPILLAVALGACGGGEPPAPQPSSTTTVPGPPPPATTTAAPVSSSDYFTVERANEFFLDDGEYGGVIARLQRLHWQGFFDVQKVVNECPSAWGRVFSLSLDEARTFTNTGFLLEQEGRRFERNFHTVNRRCPTDETFCGRVEVAKVRWADYVERYDAHITVSNQLRDEAHAEACAGSRFDSIAGWAAQCCEAR